MIAIGVEPNIKLAYQSGLKIKKGISVNKQLQTSDPHIYAIGDCASFPFMEKTIRLESIQNSVDQAKIVADHIVKKNVAYEPLPWFWSNQYNLKLQIVGIIPEKKNDLIIRTLGWKETNKFSNFIFKDNNLICVESINSPGDHLRLRNNRCLWNNIHKDLIKTDTNLKELFQLFS